MTICGLAAGSSHGRSVLGFCWVAITARLLELSRRRGAPTLGSEERPLDDPRAYHAPLPHQFAVEINLRPQRTPGREMRCIDHGERQVAFGGGRPDRGRHAARLTAQRLVAVEQRVEGRLRALDVQAHEQAAAAAALLLEERTAAGEMSLAEVDQPGEAELERRA